MAISNKLQTMTWGDFKGAHPGVAGGRGTQALAARFRKAKGLTLTPALDAALKRQAIVRTRALQDPNTAYLAQPGKPLPDVTHDMLGPPDAPRIGGRTQPGTTPRQGMRKMIPGLNGTAQLQGPPQPGFADLLRRLGQQRGGAGDNEVYKRPTGPKKPRR